MADDSHGILMVYHSLFLSKIRKDVTNLLSAAVVIGALRVKPFVYKWILPGGLIK